ncbi:MAG: glycosyltransferase family 2 protein [Spirochaetota bacterium]|nr:glycosyltransferase family 2 protein [Spirochaetota bacterium]
MLSIIIVNYKTSRDISICLESIVENERNYSNYEFIIVDNNSDDSGLKNISENYNFVNIIYAPKNGGFAYGNNIGIKASSGDCILLLNPDTYIIENNSIEKLYNHLKQNHDINFIGPQLLYPDKSNQSYYHPKSNLTLWRLFCERLFLHRMLSNSKLFNSYFMTYMDYKKPKYVEQINGAAFMFKRDVIDKIGLLDENYFMYFEESDYCLQAIKNGYRLLYYPYSRIIHKGGLIAESNWVRSTRDYIISFKYYFKKNYNNSVYFIAMLLFFIGTMIRIITLWLKGNKKYSYYLFYLKYLFKT